MVRLSSISYLGPQRSTAVMRASSSVGFAISNTDGSSRGSVAETRPSIAECSEVSTDGGGAEAAGGGDAHALAEAHATQHKMESSARFTGPSSRTLSATHARGLPQRRAQRV